MTGSCSHGLCWWTKNEGKSTAKNPLDVKAFLDTLIHMFWTFAEILQQRVVRQSVSNWPSAPIRDEKRGPC